MTTCQLLNALSRNHEIRLLCRIATHCLSLLSYYILEWFYSIDFPDLISLVTSCRCDSVDRYLYCEQLELSEDSVFAVLYAAKKYLVTSLARRCVVYLESVLSPENACMFLENVFLFEDEYPALRQRCFQVTHARLLSAVVAMTRRKHTVLQCEYFG